MGGGGGWELQDVFNYAFPLCIPFYFSSFLDPGPDGVLPTHCLDHTCQIHSRSW